MAARFKTDEELLATGWRRMTRDEVESMTCMDELASKPCFMHPDVDSFFATYMRDCQFNQNELDKLLLDSKTSAFDVDGRLINRRDGGFWTVSSMMLTDDSNHKCEPVGVSLFFATMACKVCGRDM